MTRRTYRGDDIEVTFDVALCIHSTADQVSAVVERCPTGALQHHRLDGHSDEQTSATTTVTPIEDGPLAMRGDIVVRHDDGTFEHLPRAALCRCGQSKNKPFCDLSHLDAGFHASGVTPAEAVAPDWVTA